MSKSKRGPVLIDLDDTDIAEPSAAAPVPDTAPQQSAMHQVAALAARKPSKLGRLFWSLLLAITGFVVSLAAWDYINGWGSRKRQCLRLWMADVFTALTANLRMIRRIAEIYGGRSGAFGSWRLTRTVLTHLVATGAVADRHRNLCAAPRQKSGHIACGASQRRIQQPRRDSDIKHGLPVISV